MNFFSRLSIKYFLPLVYILSVFFSKVTFSKDIPENEYLFENIFGSSSQNKFSYYQPNYFIFGKDDLKLQFGGKYKLANAVDLYLGYTQTMFWSIYSNSQPFKDINYHPDIFYRIIDDEGQFIKSIDLGYLHSSNGKNGIDSRSLHRLYVKSNVKTRLGRHLILGNFMLYDVISAEEHNKNIKDYLGYWSFSTNISHIIVYQKQRLDLEFKIFSGKKIVNFKQGGQTIGAYYHLGSEHFNPSFYLQFYNGYAENLLEYMKKNQQIRLGFLLYI